MEHSDGKDALDTVEGGLESARSQRAVEWGARSGYAVSGLLHLLIGYIALKVAWGGRGKADTSGALAILAESVVGGAALLLTVVGLAMLAFWHAATAVVRRQALSKGDLAKNIGKALLYGSLSTSAFAVFRGARGSDEKKVEATTRDVLGIPGGWVLVLVGAAGLLAAGGYHVYKGWTKGFLSDLEKHPGTFVERAGRVGYIAKGVALAFMAWLLGVAAITGRAKEAAGMDGALKEVAHQAWGTAMLTGMALGFAAYGVYSFARARHARMT